MKIESKNEDTLPLKLDLIKARKLLDNYINGFSFKRLFSERHPQNLINAKRLRSAINAVINKLVYDDALKENCLVMLSAWLSERHPVTKGEFWKIYQTILNLPQLKELGKRQNITVTPPNLF